MTDTLIHRRETVDLDGDAVDLLPAEWAVQYWYLQGAVPAKLLVGRVAEALGSLGRVYRRHRQLDLPLWQARLVVDDVRRFDLLAMPLRAPVAVRRHLEAALGELVSTAGQGGLTKFESRPIARYEHGQIILYKRSDASHDQERVHGLEALPGVQWRSAELISAPGPVSLAKPTGAAFPRHDLQRWNRSRNEILLAIERLKHPLDVDRIAAVAEQVGGIAVLAETDPYFLRLGCIRLDALDDENTAAVTVLINARLSAGERCVTLLHELAHYILHFPLLLDAQWVDDLAHLVPEMELLFAAAASQHLVGGLARLEEQANLLASALLVPVPPSTRKAWISKHMIVPEWHEMPVEEWIARDLQPYFPELAAPAWNYPAARTHLRALGARAAAAAGDLNHASPGSLLQAIFAAVLQRDHSQALDIDALSAELMPVLQEQEKLRAALSAALCNVPARGWADAARDWLGQGITLGTLQHAGAWSPSVVRDCGKSGIRAAGELASLATGTDRELVPPPGWDQIHCLFPRQRLQPADWNPNGSAEGEWVPLGEPDAPVGTLAEYFENGPPGHGLALYRFTAWQKALLRRRTERIDVPPEWLEGLPANADPDAVQWALRSLLAASQENRDKN